MSRRNVLGCLAGLMMLSTSAARAQMPQMPIDSANQFKRIEQPIALKAGVIVGGVALIGLELWWFLSKPANR
ncbi:hypothetical protein ACKFKG_22495 [Phormidesmis sp. 146-35]